MLSGMSKLYSSDEDSSGRVGAIGLTKGFLPTSLYTFFSLSEGIGNF